MSVSVGDSGLCCCACVMTFKHKLTPLCVEDEGKSEKTGSAQHSEVWVLGTWVRELGQRNTQRSGSWVHGSESWVKTHNTQSILGYVGPELGQHSEV